MDVREHPGWRAREKDVEMGYRLNENLCDIKSRLSGRPGCPKWLLKALDEAIYKSNCLLRPLIEHRNELPVAYQEQPSHYTFTEYVKKVTP
jgi:hypothetical protein